jgi:hypothetical protein
MSLSRLLTILWFFHAALCARAVEAQNTEPRAALAEWEARTVRLR